MLKKVLLSAVALGVLAGSAMAQDVKVLRIGLDGSENEADQIRNTKCVADGLKAATGVSEVQVFPSPDYNGVIQGLLGGTIDIASMGASSYAKIALADPKAVDPILTTAGADGSTGYYTIMVARKDSGIKDWPDLKGKIACVSQGSNYTQPLIEQYGAQVKALPSQPESLLALKGGNCDVSVHVNGTLSLMLQDRADEWKDYGILIPTDLIPSDSVIWLRKGEADTQAALDKIVKELHASGKMIEFAKANRLPSIGYMEEQQKKLSAAQ